MNEDAIEKLALAYAQTKLSNYLTDNPNDDYNEELRYFLKCYWNAIITIPNEFEDID